MIKHTTQVLRLVNAECAAGDIASCASAQPREAHLVHKEQLMVLQGLHCWPSPLLVCLLLHMLHHLQCTGQHAHGCKVYKQEKGGPGSRHGPTSHAWERVLRQREWRLLLLQQWWCVKNVGP